MLALDALCQPEKNLSEWLALVGLKDMRGSFFSVRWPYIGLNGPYVALRGPCFGLMPLSTRGHSVELRGTMLLRGVRCRPQLAMNWRKGFLYRPEFDLRMPL